MASNQQEPSAQKAPEDAEAAVDGDRVVISGMAGLYPQARYIKDLENILYNKLNPVTADDLRWNYNHPEVAQYTGKIPDLDRFDAQFFKVHYRLAMNMDSMSRKILEQTYEAIYDAGLSPEHLSGKKVGVYIGTCFSETEKTSFYVTTSRTGLGIAGCSKAMFANRISYWLNAKGPSVSIDEACCSSTAAFEAAFKAISHGECEAAIVGGANLCLHPQSSIHYGRIMSICKDGKTKSFAEDAAGCAKSEAINVLFLQKAKDAKRIYANVVHVKSEFVSIMKGVTGPRYGFYRDPADTAKFLNEFYDEAGVPPGAVEYVEAFGSAVPEVDKSELEAIDKVFCCKRKEPLLVGSVMSNIGYGEAASGISAVTKVLLGFHKGSLAGNLHYETPRRDVAGLCEGRMRVLTDNQCFGRTYAAINSMSVSGVNAHVLLHGHYKNKDLQRYKADIPRLVTISARQDSSVERILDYLKDNPIDPEELALIHNIHETNITGHLGKGYTILDTNAEGATVSLAQCAEYSDDVQRPLWFVYSGMGSQWAGMGAQLMRIPIFAAAIERCHKVLEPKGLNIVDIISSPDKTIFNNILHSFVGIAAVQIGLTDILLQLGLVPDKIIGHSVGELGCAYADGCFTAEEMILAAYSRGRVSLETPFVRGSMAAVGLGAQQISSMCPPEIDIACHNSAESCTISGPEDVMRSFVANLTAQQIFAKEVPSSNIAYHSRYISEAGPGLLKYLKEVIPTPKAISERWVSSSVPQDKWPTHAKYSSAEYHTNNLLCPVLFEEASALVPPNAVLVEVAPHGLLQAILKRALPVSTTNIPITRRGHSDSVVMLLEAIGKIYLQGYHPKVRVLYPEVEFPVSTGTPFLSHFVEWAHQEKWSLPLYQTGCKKIAASCTYVITIHDEEYSYITDHVVNNKTLLPFSYVLVATWDTLAMSLNVPRKSISVEFHDVKLYTQPILHEEKIVKLSVTLHRGNGRFEVMDDGSKVATGYITSIETPEIETMSKLNTSQDNELEAQEMYQILHERGYAYSGAFRSIYGANECITESKVYWNDNWVTFIDSLFQLNTLKYTKNGISQPDHIRKMVIDVKMHLKCISDNREANNKLSLVHAELCEMDSTTRSGGLLIENLNFRNVLQMNEEKVSLQTLKFVPRFNENVDVSTALYVFLQIAAENKNKDSMNILGVTYNSCTTEFFESLKKIVEAGIPKRKIQYQQISIDNAITQSENMFENVDVVLVQNLSKYDDKVIKNFYNILQPNTFIVNEEEIAKSTQRFLPKSYSIVSILKSADTKLELAYWKPTLLKPLTSTFTIHSDSDLALLEYARKNLSPESNLLIFTSYPPVPGLMGLVKKWRREVTCNNIYVIMIDEKSGEIHELSETPVLLAYNVLQNGFWGGEYFLPLEENSTCNENITLRIETIGDINSLKWVQTPALTESGMHVAVHYAGLNIGDVKRSLGLIDNNNSKYINTGYGIDYSGITERGERVMGLVSGGAISSSVVALPELTWPVPAHWTLEDAATVPFAYIYAYYCLVTKSTYRANAAIVKQTSILVHGGAGALGQATISIALARGWRVFTTVGDCDKKRFLMRLFPQLNELDIGYSRDSSFANRVLNATNGKGCNVVICCLKGDLKNTSLSCCAPSGTVLDTVQILTNENYSYGMNNLTYERSYVAVDISSIFNDLKSKEVQKLHALVSEGIACGEVRPLTRVTFAPDEAARAFRLLAASRHRGRALLRLNDRLAPPTHRVPSEAVPCHIVIGGSNLLGLQVANKVISYGAQKLHLHFNEPTRPLLRYKLCEWKKQNIEVVVTCGNLKDTNDVLDLLHNATDLGPIEGIHLVTNDSLEENVISLLDVATRTACPSLKRFVVLANDIRCGQNTCIQRAKDGLPATLLDLSILKTLKDADGGRWHRSVAVAVERTLCCTDTVLLAVPESKTHHSLLHQIAALTGFNIASKTENNVSLQELGMQVEKSSFVCDYLKDVYHFSISEEDILKLRIEEINKIESRISPIPLPEVTGLEIFFSYVDPDELLATTEMVLLPTLTHNNEMRDDEYYENETFLCIVPGLEGHHARFRALCERLKLPAFVLQPGLDHPDETPAEQALRYSKILERKTTMKNKFYILGYETGVVVALELASILEDHGLSGTVFCLGDGPMETIALLERALSPFPTEEALQEAVARHMFALMTRDSAANMGQALHGHSSWRERVDACVRLLLGHVPHSAQYARSLLESAYARISAARRASAPRMLRSQLVLLRARCEDNHAENTCSLQRYSQQTLQIRNLVAPIAHATIDPRAATIINSYLDNYTLEEFEKKNLCDTYLMDAGIIG